MRFQHAHPAAEGVVEPVTPRFDPQHHPDDQEIEKEDEVRDVAEGEGHRDDRRRAGYCPRGGQVEPLPPDHDPSDLTAVEVRHGRHVAVVVQRLTYHR